MASAAITITGQPATIESDTSEAVITNGEKVTDGNGFRVNWRTRYGELYNMGPADVFVKVSVDPNTPAASVATTLAQAQAQFPLPAGGYLTIRKTFYTIAHLTVAGTATLAWSPMPADDDGR